MAERVLEKKNQLKVHECSTWDEFRNLSQEVVLIRNGEKEEVKSFPLFSIYRGHAEREWKLSSMFDRTIPVMEAIDQNGVRRNISLKNFENESRYEEYCKGILDNFRYNCKGMSEITGNESDNELWAIGRHFGLLTPLLDWTKSPYIAAFFALAKIYQQFQIGKSIPTVLEDGKSCVWALHIFPDLQKRNEFGVIEIPPLYKSRQRAQCGLYTKLVSKNHMHIESYLEQQGILFYLELFEIKNTAAIAGLRDLELMNINLLTLFPDLHGAAVQANIAVGGLQLGLLDYKNF